MISIKEAKRLSLIKWRGELNDTPDYSGLKDYPNLREHFYCGFCLRHGYTYPDTKNVCKNCELALTNAGVCSKDGSLYDRIENIETDVTVRDSLIQELIEIIENIPEDGEN